MFSILFQAAGPFPNILQVLENYGFFLYLFPFLLTLAVVYGVLSWALPDQLPNSARALISLIFAFFVMLYTSLNTGIVNFFANLGGAGLIVGSGILFLAILLGLTGFKISEIYTGAKTKWIFVFAIVIIAILIFLGAGADMFGLIPYWSTSGDFLTIVFFVIIIALVLFWMGSEGKPAAPAEGKTE